VGQSAGDAHGKKGKGWKKAMEKKKEVLGVIGEIGKEERNDTKVKNNRLSAPNPWRTRESEA